MPETDDDQDLETRKYTYTFWRVYSILLSLAVISGIYWLMH